METLAIIIAIVIYLVYLVRKSPTMPDDFEN